LKQVVQWIVTQTAQPSWVKGVIVLISLLLGWGVGQSYRDVDLVVVTRFLYVALVGLFAFSSSWSMFPQVSMWLTQTANPSISKLFRLLMRRMSVLTLGILLFMTSVLLGATNPEFHAALLSVWVDMILFVAGLVLFTTSRFLTVGFTSQLWQEGRKGQAYMNVMKEMSSAGAGVPAGAVPTVLATGGVALIGMLLIVFQSWIQGLTGMMIPGIGGMVMMALGGYTWLKRKEQLDLEFYHTHGFYNELFRNPGGKADTGREPIPIVSLYWVPNRLKPALWLTLRQMDRKYPVGRIMVLVFLLYWGIIKTDLLDVRAWVVVPIAGIVLRNLLVLVLDRTPYSGMWYRRELGEAPIWFGVLLFTGLRWLVPMHLFLGLTTWFVSELTTDHMILWMVIDLMSLLIISGFGSIYRSLEYAKNYR